MRNIQIIKKLEEGINLANQFKETGFINLSEYFTDEIKKHFTRALEKALEENGVRTFFDSVHTNLDPTPMHLYTVRKKELDDSSNFFKEFYHSEELMQFLRQITENNIYFINYEPEKYVLNALVKPQDTFGWHWDNYAYALVYIAHCPPYEGGGQVEFIPYTNKGNEYKEITPILNNNAMVTQITFEPESFYLMRSDKHLHRVKPVNEGFKRLAIALTYRSQECLEKKLTHKDIEEIYG